MKPVYTRNTMIFAQNNVNVYLLDFPIKNKSFQLVGKSDRRIYLVIVNTRFPKRDKIFMRCDLVFRRGIKFFPVTGRNSDRSKTSRINTPKNLFATKRIIHRKNHYFTSNIKIGANIWQSFIPIFSIYTQYIYIAKYLTLVL